MLVNSVLRLENAKVQRARQTTSCSQIRCQVGTDLIVEDPSHHGDGAATLNRGRQ